MSETMTDALDKLTASGVRVCWITQLGRDGVSLTAYRVLLLDSALSPAAAGRVARKVMNGHVG